MLARPVRPTGLRATIIRAFRIAGLGALVASALSVSALGQWCPTPIKPCDPNDPNSTCYKPKKPDCKCPKFCQMSPCFVSSGAYYTSVTDLQIKTPGSPLVASRTYTSSHALDGPLGFGWQSNLAARLYYATYLFAAPSTYQKEADVVMPDGSLYRFVQNTDGTFTPPQTRHDILTQNVDGTFDLTLQRTRSKLHFASTGTLIAQIDDYGNALNLTYDASGKLQQLADGAGSGRYINVFWGPDGRIASLQDSASRQVQYAYNPQGVLNTVTDPATRVTTYSYVTGRLSPLLSEIKDPWSRVVTDVTYDTADRVKTYTDAGETYSYTYVYGGNSAVTSKTDSSGNTFIYPFSAAGFVTDTTPPSGGGSPTHTDYYADGSVQQFIDGVGVRTYYTYDTQGNVLTVTKDYQGPTAVRFDYVYDPGFVGRVTSITPKDPSTGNTNTDWQAWQFDYYQAGSPAPGALHHALRVKNTGASETLATYVYNSKGQVTQKTSAVGGVTDYGYDAQGNLTTVTLPANNDSGTRPVVVYGYDSLGRALTVTDALGKVSSYGYDALDRVTTVTRPKPSSGSTLSFVTSYTYDTFASATGLVLTTVADPNGRIVKQGYDQFGHLGQVVDNLGDVTSYGYTKGLLTSIADANNNVTTYSYDGGRRLIEAVFPDGAYEQYTYTGDNLLDTKTDRKNQTINYDYDRFKRLSLKTYPGGGSVTYTYTGQKLTQVVDTSVSPAETHTFGYDPSYRVSTEAQASRGTINYLYNTDDTIQNYAIQSGPSATYTYYPDSTLNTIVWSPVAGTFKYRYTLPGLYQSTTFPSGATRNYTYDDQGRLTTLTNLTSGSANLATYSYGYDYNYTTGQYTMLGERSSMTATVPAQNLNNHLFKYEYDGVYELTKVTYPNVAPFNAEVDSWAYDAIGNRLSSTVNGATLNYTYQRIGSNPLNWQRLLNDGVNSYTYDNNGNTQTRAGTSFTWNYDDRLTAITGTSSYGYDYLGRRSSKTLSSTTTYLYRGQNLVREAGASSADYLFGPGIDEPLAMSRGGATYYYAVDGLGSVAVVTSSSGTVQDTYLYEAWGQTKSQTGSLADPFGYTAREFSELGALFYRARYYLPAIGRFQSADPLRIWSASREHSAEGQQAVLGSPEPAWPYTYAQNDPVSLRDPSGSIPISPRCLWRAWRCNNLYTSCKNAWCAWFSSASEEQMAAVLERYGGSIENFNLQYCFFGFDTCRAAVESCGEWITDLIKAGGMGGL